MDDNKILALAEYEKKDTQEVKIFLGDSPIFKKEMEKASKIAPYKSSVLIGGETGTGKTEMAKYIHSRSGRKGRFVKINCSAFQDTLLEADLFGHEKGSFTGADRSRAGKMREADGGTIFFDEIGDMSPSFQQKILTLLEDGKFYPVGSSKEIVVDVRFIMATNKNLEIEVEKGRFRQDLYFRFNTFCLVLPPLRARGDDIERLIWHFRDLFNIKFGKNAIISGKAFSIMRRYTWPGNVRELINKLEKAVLYCENEKIEPEDLDIVLFEKKAFSDKLVNWKDFNYSSQRNYLVFLLKEFNGNRTTVSKILDLQRTYVSRLIGQFKIKDEELN